MGPRGEAARQRKPERNSQSQLELAVSDLQTESVISSQMSGLSTKFRFTRSKGLLVNTTTRVQVVVLLVVDIGL